MLSKNVCGPMKQLLLVYGLNKDDKTVFTGEIYRLWVEASCYSICPAKLS